MDFYVYRESVILSTISMHFGTADHFWMEVCDGINLGKGCFEATAVGSQQEQRF
jgi:hypothetical protein